MWAASYTREDDRGTEAPVSLDALYRAHAPVVARWAAHLGGPSLDVQDAVHEIFLIVRRRLPEFRGESKPTTWLYRITERVIRDRRRKERFHRWVHRVKRDQIEDALATTRPNPEEEIQRQQASARLYQVLDRMPEKYRQVLVLFEMEEMAGEEIAALTGIKVATVWVRLHRARERFRAEMRRLQKETP